MTKTEAKKELRRLMVQARQNRPWSERQKFSRLIARRVLTSPLIKKARVVAVYLSFGSEVETHGLVHRLWKLNKTVVIPISSVGLKNSFFVLYRPADRLHPTKLGPKEVTGPHRPFQMNDIDVLLVPGLAVDKFGGRLGYGGGVYDRFLTQAKRAHAIGLIFSFQEINRVPREHHDRSLDGWISEEGGWGQISDLTPSRK